MVTTIPSTVKMWKYLSIALMGLLATGFLVPQAFAHITTNTQHMVEHFYNMLTGIDTKVTDIQTKTNAIKATVDTNLDAKVSSRANQTSVNNLQASANGISTKIDNLPAKTDITSILNALPTKVIGPYAITSQFASKDEIVCTSDHDFLVHYAPVGHGPGADYAITPRDESGNIFGNGFGSRLEDSEMGTQTVGTDGGKSIEVFVSSIDPATSTSQGFVTLQTTQGAVASCTIS